LNKTHAYIRKIIGTENNPIIVNIKTLKKYPPTIEIIIDK
jgi:hypothetical protein